ncbi:MAG: hypothetical protein GY862_35890 [Gammaproteobacteria bacterium]|nr:hypothetical protein [Gammaproteobacteria bacterium]
MPKLLWTAPHQEERRKKDSFLPRVPDDANQPPPASNTEIPAQKTDLNAISRERARNYEEQEDYLAAAVCYNMLDDAANSARCYRKTVWELR